ncbi:fatty acid desaturase [Polyangium sp. y55x31]|uniref:fatty acid desaturase family protein n=1 Tax=Polyangium sp. y55x31 TaxID=3042688 RepID=UPI0024828CE2|nr:fatty acid desaturase [Polyangium sp. y55x31]
MTRRGVSLADIESRPSEVTFLLKFSLYLVLVAYGIRLATSGPLVLKIIGVVVLGLMFAHGVELQHQALHKQGFRNGKLNEIAGILLGLPMLVSFAGYQAAHLRHHKYLGTPANAEFFDYGDSRGGSRGTWLWLWFNRLMMPSHYLAVMKNLWRSLHVGGFSSERPEVSARMRRDHLVMLLAILALGAASAATHASLILEVWVLPLVLVATPVHALIEMPEHYRCDVSSTDVFRNTRTIETNVLMCWYTNGNNYHVEHHLMPSLPIDRLHDLHRAIRKDIVFCHTGYRDFYAALLRGRLATPERPVAEHAATS